MAKKFVTEEGLSQVVDAVVDAIKKVSDKQITEEKVTEEIDAKVRDLDVDHLREIMATLEGRIDGCVTNEALGSKIEEAIGVANVEPIKDKIKTLNGRIPKANEGSGDTHTEETAANSEEPPIMVAPVGSI